MIGEEEFELICLRLRNNDPCLVELDLSASMVNNYRAKHIAVALQTNTTLTALNLRFNPITEEGERSIVDALDWNTSVISIVLYIHPIELREKRDFLITRNKFILIRIHQAAKCVFQMNLTPDLKKWFAKRVYEYLLMDKQAWLI